MNGREIPGFFYDAEKNKYFKIQENHVAPPAASKYSRETVGKRKRHTQELNQKKERRALETTQLIRRAKILQNPSIAGIALHRELSLCRPVRIFESRLKAYGAGLVQVPGPKASGNSFAVRFGVFSFAPSFLSYVYAPSTRQDDHMICTVGPGSGSSSESRIPVGSLQQRWFNPRVTSTISSISVSPNGSIIATELGNGGPPVVHLYHRYDGLTRERSKYKIIQRDDEETLWSSAANTFLESSGAELAAGMTGKVELWTAKESEWDLRVFRHLKGDAFSMDWLAPTSLAIGQRNGFISLWDTRSNGSALRLRHPSNVIGLRCANSNNIVACGIEDALAMYDLRMPRVGKPGRWLPQSQPVVRYAYTNKFTPHRGFDIHRKLGIVAAVDENNVVQMYSLQTGASMFPQTAKKTHPSMMVSHGHPIPCVQFVDIGDGEDFLAVSQGDGLVTLRWDGSDNDEEHDLGA